MVNLYDWDFDFPRKSATAHKKETSQEIVESTVDALEKEAECALEACRMIEEKNKDHSDSLNYAKLIQNAIIHKKDQLEKVLPQSFILNMPLNIVSGDFVRVETNQSKTLISLADCTGHGIPGAMISMIGCSLLCEIINHRNVVYPPAILQLLDASFKELTKGDHSISDGMDIGLCNVDLQKMELSYSGANRPLYHIRNGNLTEVKSDNLSIGGNACQEKKFTNHTIELQKNDRVYMFSDGYTDQFGGVFGKKFSSKRFKSLLLSIQHLNMEEQEIYLKKTIIEWRGEHAQIDDICVLGIRI